jgi:carbon-monoxide dehydrogenase medium subunit
VQLRLAANRVEEVRITLTNVGATPLRATEAEDVLRGEELDARLIAEAARLAMGICAPSADQRGDEEYKTAMAGEMTVRALRTARDRAALVDR